MPSAMTDQELQQRLTLERYPLSAKYPARWVADNRMGPNPLWLAESLAEVMPLEPGARVLDMGCGKALTSIFLTSGNRQSRRPVTAEFVPSAGPRRNLHCPR